MWNLTFTTAEIYRVLVPNSSANFFAEYFFVFLLYKNNL